MKYPCPKCQKPLTKSATAPSGKKRWRCGSHGNYCYSTTNPKGTAARKQDGSTKRRKIIKFVRMIGRTVERVIVTAAQNATPAHKGFVASIETACKRLNAEPIAIPTRYKNPTSKWTESQANDETWDAAITPWLCNVRKSLNKNLKLMGDIKVQPTASDPLTGFDAITHGESGIFGHTKIRLRTVAVPQGRFPKILTTTGACTVPNYTDSRAGALGAFHHSLAAVLVEFDGRKFHLRQLNANKTSGEFMDLDTHYSPSGAKKIARAEALVTGDLHARFACKKSLKATAEQIAFLRPKVITWDDVADMHSVSPHHRHNPFAAIAKSKSGWRSPHDEIKHAIDLIASMTPDESQSWITASNHHEMLARHIRDTDWKLDPDNAEFYLETARMMAAATRMTKNGVSTPDPFIYWARKHAETLGKKIRFLELDESASILGVEFGIHGHFGPNGARGSLRNLRRIGSKTFVRHIHSPGIDEGAYGVGTLGELIAEYTHGVSSWLGTNGVLYATGKRSLLNMIEGDWRL